MAAQSRAGWIRQMDVPAVYRVLARLMPTAGGVSGTSLVPVRQIGYLGEALVPALSFC